MVKNKYVEIFAREAEEHLQGIRQGLLAMEKEERGVFGVALSGDVVMRDVPQTTVSFDAHRFLDPSADGRENSFNL